MSQNAFQTLNERGFIYQSTDEAAIEKMLAEEKTTFYIGFDPTAISLQVGNLVPIMAMCHMQSAGHTPIVIVGGGTALVGDPSGKTEMRKMLTLKQIDQNAAAQKKQFAKYIDFNENKAYLLNNAEWLTKLNYIELLRDIGRHFSVNRMLTAESYKMRLETGLSFLEFNYMILQAYDFYFLAQKYDCRLQMGGQDQWGNIVAGADLTRRLISKPVEGMTFPLIMNAQGQKFGKSVAGAVWLDEKRTPVFDYYQFWRNADDADVARLLGLFTFLPIDEVKRLGSLEPPLINRSKEILAYEATRITHGAKAAETAYQASVKQFGSADPKGEIATSSDIRKIIAETAEALPTTSLEIAELGDGINLIELFVKSGLCPTNSEARRLITQGGAYINNEAHTDPHEIINQEHLENNELLLRAGKKRFKRITFE
ncbi:tyrosine--tRNA ligase [candidate division KSB1 bacterium]|nr:tyrosine--tRNA ligase [candidate division KSB1 bacterium]